MVSQWGQGPAGISAIGKLSLDKRVLEPVGPRVEDKLVPELEETS